MFQTGSMQVMQYVSVQCGYFLCYAAYCALFFSVHDLLVDPFFLNFLSHRLCELHVFFLFYFRVSCPPYPINLLSLAVTCLCYTCVTCSHPFWNMSTSVPSLPDSVSLLRVATQLLLFFGGEPAALETSGNCDCDESFYRYSRRLKQQLAALKYQSTYQYLMKV